MYAAEPFPGKLWPGQIQSGSSHTVTYSQIFRDWNCVSFTASRRADIILTGRVLCCAARSTSVAATRISSSGCAVCYIVRLSAALRWHCSHFSYRRPFCRLRRLPYWSSMPPRRRSSFAVRQMSLTTATLTVVIRSFRSGPRWSPRGQVLALRHWRHTTTTTS